MPVFIPTNGVEAMEVKVTLIQGNDLIAKDRNMMGKRTTSDPYCIVKLQTTMPGVGRTKPKTTTSTLGQTKTITKDLNPKWNESFTASLPCPVLQDPAAPPKLIFELYDHDKNGDDDCMGILTLPLTDVTSKTSKDWYDIPKDSVKNAKGKLEIHLQTVVHSSTTLQSGNSFALPSDNIRIGLAWDLDKGKAVDLDAACVALDNQGRVAMDYSVYYGNLTSPNESIVHSGDSKDGKSKGEDESIQFRLNQIPPSIVALYIVLTVASPRRYLSNVATARMTIWDESKPASVAPLAAFAPSKHIHSEDATALFLVRIARGGGGSSQWILQPIEHSHPTARDFGTLIPFFKSYTRDLIPNIKVDPKEIVSIMRKGGAIKIRDFCPGNVLPDAVTFGLSWDMNTLKGGKTIDLDASCICLDAELQCVDKVWYKQLQSDDGGIVHSGDQRRGDAVGDDECIAIILSKISKRIKYIGFVVNSYTGQELDDVQRAACHLFDTETKTDIAMHTMSNCEILNGHTALVMCVLYRVNTRGGSSDSDWCLKIVGQAAQGKNVKDNIDELQAYLEENLPAAPLEKSGTGVEEEIPVEAEMPTKVPVEAM